MTADAIFIDIDAESRPFEAFNMAFTGRQRGRRNVFGKPGVREGECPADIGNDGCDVERGRAGDARFSGLA